MVNDIIINMVDRVDYDYEFGDKKDNKEEDLNNILWEYGVRPKFVINGPFMAYKNYKYGKTIKKFEIKHFVAQQNISIFSHLGNVFKGKNLYISDNDQDNSNIESNSGTIAG